MDKHASGVRAPGLGVALRHSPSGLPSRHGPVTADAHPRTLRAKLLGVSAHASGAPPAPWDSPAPGEKSPVHRWLGRLRGLLAASRSDEYLEFVSGVVLPCPGSAGCAASRRASACFSRVATVPAGLRSKCPLLRPFLLSPTPEDGDDCFPPSPAFPPTMRRHVGMLEYMNSQGAQFAEAAAVFAEAAGLEPTVGQSSGDVKGLLEKKWTSVVRLQRKASAPGGRALQSSAGALCLSASTQRDDSRSRAARVTSLLPSRSAWQFDGFGVTVTADFPSYR